MLLVVETICTVTVLIQTTAFKAKHVFFFQESIQKASTALKQSIQLCNFYRKRHTFSESFGKMVKKQNYDHYTPGKLFCKYFIF